MVIWVGRDKIVGDKKLEGLPYTDMKSWQVGLATLKCQCLESTLPMACLQWQDIWLALAKARGRLLFPTFVMTQQSTYSLCCK